MSRTLLYKLLGLALVIAALTGCATKTPQPVSSAPFQVPVHSVEVLQVIGSPNQLRALVRGELPDGCSRLGSPAVEVSGTLVVVILPAYRDPSSGNCAGSPAPYEQAVELGGAFTPGSYSVQINGVDTAFTLAGDVGPAAASGQPSAAAQAGNSGANTVSNTTSGASGSSTVSGSAEQVQAPTAVAAAAANNQPAANTQPAASSQAAEQQPAASQPEASNQPAAASQPAANNQPAVSNQPAAAGQPAANAQPAASTQPAVSNQPAANNQPASQTAQTTQSTPATQTTVPSVPVTAQVQAAGAAQAGCANKAAFYGDVTIDDGTVMEPGQAFTKTWQVKNVGTCTWSGYLMVLKAGEALSAAQPVALDRSVNPGELVQISIKMTAPQQPGAYYGDWLLSSQDGQPFGTGAGGDGRLWVKIGVRAPAPQGGASPVCLSQTSGDYEAQLLQMINQARAEQGYQPLVLDERLSTAARIHSQDMGCADFVDHYGSDGSTWFTRVTAQGVKYHSASENIYAGDPAFGGTPQGAFTWWMNSQVHRDNILNPKSKKIGIGYVSVAASTYKGYYTLDFIEP